MGDLISRCELFNKLATVQTLVEAYGIIQGMETVDAVPVRHGKWVDDSDGIEGAWNYCSVCGEQAIDLYDYCPNCGARMDGKGNGNEAD